VWRNHTPTFALRKIAKWPSFLSNNARHSQRTFSVVCYAVGSIFLPTGSTRQLSLFIFFSLHKQSLRSNCIHDNMALSASTALSYNFNLQSTFELVKTITLANVSSSYIFTAGTSSPDSLSVG